MTSCSSGQISSGGLLDLLIEDDVIEERQSRILLFKKKQKTSLPAFAVLTLPEASSALSTCKASQGLMKCSLNPVPRLLHSLSALHILFFFFSLSSGVHQYQGNVCLIRLEVKATKTNRDNRAKQMTDRRPCVVAQGNRVHITAETWITKLSPEMFTDNSHFFCCCRQKQGWLNIWCLICKWRRNDHQISI